ncbi:hypothetical protein [Streptomyces sp. NPDC097619]|uniref:hypothetical protein n=1 Tax=Streptomyces sp. NPDC097619 TaxID=3157228 RepID=UPI00333006E6
MLKPTRTILALVTGSLVLGLAGSTAAVAVDGPHRDGPQSVARDNEDAERPGAGEYGQARYARGVVVSNGPLTVRSRPSTNGRAVGKVHPQEKLAIECKERGQDVRGNDIWYLLEDRRSNGNDERDEYPIGIDGRDDERPGREDMSDSRGEYGEHWVAARYVKNLNPVKWCRL